MSCESPQESLGFLLHDATRAIRRQFERLAADHGLTTSQWRVLVHLFRNGPMPQARLAELLEIEPISVSRLIDRMEDGGWVSRVADPTDRRLRIVELRDKAREIQPQAREIADALYDRALAGLPPQTRSLLIEALKTLISNLSQPTETDHDR